MGFMVVRSYSKREARWGKMGSNGRLERGN
jgi:hypothetical protein